MEVETFSSPYGSEKSAAINFFKGNLKTLKRLTSQQEMLGWVLRCEDGKFYYSEAEIGGLSNLRDPKTVENSYCDVTASLHTHPRVPRGYTVDFFSEEDVKATHAWNSYLLSQENCNVRFGSKLENRDGVLLGKLEVCK